MFWLVLHSGHEIRIKILPYWGQIGKKIKYLKNRTLYAIILLPSLVAQLVEHVAVRERSEHKIQQASQKHEERRWHWRKIREDTAIGDSIL